MPGKNLSEREREKIQKGGYVSFKTGTISFGRREGEETWEIEH